MNQLNLSWIIDGKLAGHAAPKSAADILWLKSQGIQALVRMEEESKTTITTSTVINAGLSDLHSPVNDFTAPTQLQIVNLVEGINQRLKEGKPVGVSCGAGQGRTGTILACYLVNTGLSAKEAIKLVRQKRPGSIETKEQEDAVVKFLDDLEIQRKWPKTVEEAVNRILLMLSDEEKAAIAQSESEEDVLLYHHGLGTWIRNNFGLWNGNVDLIKSCGGHVHADDNSIVLTRALWRKLHEKAA